MSITHSKNSNTDIINSSAIMDMLLKTFVSHVATLWCTTGICNDIGKWNLMYREKNVAHTFLNYCNDNVLLLKPMFIVLLNKYPLSTSLVFIMYLILLVKWDN